MLFDDKLSDIIRTLESDGVLLHPTDTTWNLSCSLYSVKAISKIYKITKQDQSQHLTILVDSLYMLKKHVPHIHPRIETLLHYHQKPLIVFYPMVKKFPEFYLNGKDNKAAIRIIHDPYCNQIIKLLGNPLVTTTANTLGKSIPTNFRDIPDTIKQGADSISKHKRNVAFSAETSVTIDYNQEGEINFLQL